MAGLHRGEPCGQRGHRRHPVLSRHFRLLKRVLPLPQPGKKKNIAKTTFAAVKFLYSQNFWRFGFLLYYEDFAARIRIILQYSDPTRFRIRIRVSKMFFPHLHLCSLDILNICIVLLKREENFNGYSLSKVHRVE